MRRAALCVFVVFVLAVAPVGAAVSSGPLGAVSVAGDGAVGHQLEVPLGGTAGDPSATTPLLCGSWLSRRPCWITLTGPFVQVSVGAHHSCGLRADSTIECSGSNRHGQATAPQGSFVQVSAGVEHSCGLRDDGTISCWGSNKDGQTTTPQGSFTHVSAGAYHSCGLHDDTTISCWGSNKDGQTTTPQGSFTHVSAGAYHSCGLHDDSTISCWGSNRHGQTTTPQGSFTHVSAGAYYSCGLRADSTIECWDGVYSNDDGQVSRVPSPPEGPFTQVSAGGAQACGLRDDGTVQCWGFRYPPGGAQECGLRDDGTVHCWSPYQPTGDTGRVFSPAEGPLTQVSAGWSQACGLRDDGSALCWGSAYAARTTDTVEGRGSGAGDDAGIHQQSVDALRQQFPRLFEGTGCGQGLCPQEPLRRWEMAVWLVRVLDETTPTRGTRTGFVDVDSAVWYSAVWWAPYTGRLANLGVTTGCKTAPLRYCPNNPATRAQIATFLSRAFNIEAAPGSGFTDTSGSTHESSIDAIAAAGITSGCETEPLRYCPNDPVTRAQMATFLARVLNLI